MTFEIRTDCPRCRVEGARLEIWDGDAAACRLGVPETVRCKLCQHAATARVAAGTEAYAPGDGCPGCGTELDDGFREAHRCPFCGATADLEDTATGVRIDSLATLDDALARWAREEALGDADELLEAYFALTSSAAIFDAMGRGEAIETTFDVADYLFSSGGASGGGGERAVMRPPEEENAPNTVRSMRPSSIQRFAGPREELLALASVAAADGEASPDDQAVLLRAATRRGVQALAPEDLRVWRPNEVDPPATLPDRERVLEEMFQMAWADGQMDESELRVIRDYARAWGIDPERVRAWIELYGFGDQNRVERWLRRIGLFLFPGR